MKIAVIGAGAIGSVVAVYLSKAGFTVALVGKKEQADAINQHGLTVRGVRGEENFRIHALTRLNDHYDLVIFTVKTQDLEDAYRDNNEYLDNTFILTSQNGVQADNILSGHFDREKIFSSIVMFGATYIKPGQVVFNFEGDWIIGKPFATVNPKVYEIAEMVNKAFKTVVSSDIMGMKWLKLFVNFNNCLCAILGKPMQEAFANMDVCRLSILLLKEGVEVVRRAHIELVSLPDFPTERIYGLAAMPVDQAAAIMNKALTNLSKEPVYGSILQSIMRRRASEIDFINGEFVQLARGMMMEAPFNDRIVAMVHQVENTGRFFTAEEVKKAFNL